jgi:aerobic-type carbon monoxide dehydrogenase small subunit (CoxS/CutS family)
MIRFRLNGQDVSVDAPGDASLLFALSNDLEVNGTKYGCGRARCGSCAVLLDGEPVFSCVMPLAAVAGRTVTTLTGLRVDGQPNALQRAFIEEQAFQCGYCASGVILAAQALLKRVKRPTEQQVRAALDGHLCRCGAHNQIVRAVLRAAEESAK